MNEEITSLKAQAYDCILQMEAHQRQIEIYRQQLAQINEKIRNTVVELPKICEPEEGAK